MILQRLAVVVAAAALANAESGRAPILDDTLLAEAGAFGQYASDVNGYEHLVAALLLPMGNRALEFVSLPPAGSEEALYIAATAEANPKCLLHVARFRIKFKSMFYRWYNRKQHRSLYDAYSGDRPAIDHSAAELPAEYCARLQLLWERALQEVRNPPLPAGGEVSVMVHGGRHFMHFATATSGDGYRTGMAQQPGLGRRVSSLVDVARAAIGVVDHASANTSESLTPLEKALTRCEKEFSIAE